MLTWLKYFEAGEYPEHQEWQAFNSSIGGRLIAFEHPGSTCYAANFSYSDCMTYGIQSQSTNFTRNDPFLINYAFWAGDPCPLPQSYYFRVDQATCNQGKYPDYTVAARNAQDISTALKFAGKHNIRVVVKNTGHDFLGR
jgi:hypothetical protein